MTDRAGPEPTVTRRTPSAASSDVGGEDGPASTFSGPEITRARAEIVPASVTPGTKTQSAPASRKARPPDGLPEAPLRLAQAPPVEVGPGVHDERHVRLEPRFDHGTYLLDLRLEILGRRRGLATGGSVGFRRGCVPRILKI